MHLLLPPSETKNPGGRGRPLRTRGIEGPRKQAIDALLDLVQSDRARECLLLPPAVAANALAANAAVLDSPTTPALRRYAGTVYAGFDFAGLTEREQRIAARTVLIFSGLFGVVRGDEPVPDYRVPAKAVLPGIGVASTFWRPLLAPVLAETLRRGLVVDLRSSDYASMWRPSRADAPRVITIRVLSPAPRGGYAVISYVSKLSKGRLAAALVRRTAAGEPVRDAEHVRAAWLACGGAKAQHVAGGLDLYTS